jgi:hypothetical protein
MSIRIEKSKFTQEQKDIISKFLIYSVNQDSYYGSNETPTVIKLFLSDNENVLIPFSFAKKLCKINPPTFSSRKMNFTGSFFDHQTRVFEESKNILSEKNTVILGLYPGFGKTIMGAALSCYLNKRTCVAIVQTVLPKQWIEAFSKFTDSKVIVWDGKSIINSNIDVVIVTSGYIEKLPKDIIKSFGTLIIDEAHSFCTKTRITPLLLFEPEYIIAETATLKRPDGAEDMMKAIVGVDEIYIPLKKQFKVIKVNTKIIPDVKFNYQGKVDWNYLLKSLITNPLRNDLIVSWILNNISNKSLLLTDRKELISEITKRLEENNIKYDYLCGNKKTYNDSPVLLGTYGKIGVGFDEKNACPDFSGIRINVVYMCFSTKQHWLLEQSAGRGFRSDFPTIVDFVDDHRICLSHYKQREKWYKSRGGQIEEYTVTNY